MTTVATAEITPPAIMAILGPYSSATQPDSGEPSGAPPRNTSMYSPITRPRMAAVVPSCVAEFAAVVKLSSVSPVGHEHGEEQPEVRHEPADDLAAC